MNLFDEVSFGGVTLKNRLVMAPMGVSHAEDGGIDEKNAAYLVERAKGGFGLIYPGAVTVTDRWEHPMFDGGHLQTVSHMMRLKKVVDEVHSYGAKFALQISPGYGRVNVGPVGMTNHISASDNTVFEQEPNLCHALTVDEIQYIMECATQTAGLAVAAGVDIIETHSYGAYLVDQFMSKMWNRRTDQYGGSLENRLRFFREFVAAIRLGAGEDFPMSVKYTPVHTVPGGRTFEDEGIEIAKIMDGMGFIYMHLDCGCYEAWHRAIPSSYDPEGSQLFIAKRLREEGIKAPFLVQGKLNSPDLAKQVVEEGTAELIALGHQSIADPYWPKKVKAGRYQDIVYCICCNECLLSGECSVNPMINHEYDPAYQLKKTENPRKLLVVGGGPGGLYTAALAAKQGHDVTLWEKNFGLGGLGNAAAGPDFKFEVKRYLDHLIADVYQSDVKVRFKEATVETIDAFGADAVIIAGGAPAIVPHIKGIDQKNVITAGDLLAHKIPVGKNIVVVGGGLVGCETAVDLDNKGHNVTVVEALDEILAAPLARNSRQGLKKALSEATVTCLTSTKLVEAFEGGVKVAGPDGEYELPCDNVILAVGYKPDQSLKQALSGKPYAVFTVGDYNGPRNILGATAEGMQIVRNLDAMMDME